MNVSSTSKNPESQLEVATSMLLECIIDKSYLVSDTAIASIRKLAKQHTNQTLRSSCKFCVKTPKPSNEHIASILSIVEQICTEYDNEINEDTVQFVAKICLKDIMLVSNYEPIIQMPASNVLVALGRKHFTSIISSLISELKVGVIPHYMIVHTLGTLATLNSSTLVIYLKEIFSIILPQLGAMKIDYLKEAIAYAIGNFCDALIEFNTSGLDHEPSLNKTNSFDEFNTEINVFFDILFTNWLQSREPKVIQSVLLALSSIFNIINQEKLIQQTQKVVSTLLQLYKRQIEHVYVTKCLGSILQSAATVDGTLIEPLLINILSVLSDSICLTPDYAQPDSLRNHSEALRCYECFAQYFTDSTIDHLINQLKNNNEKERIRSILIITHLTSYSNEQIIQHRFKDILKYLNELLTDPNIKIKKALMKTIVAFAFKGVIFDTDINPDGPNKYMEFLLKLCCKPLLTKNIEINTNELYDLQKSADNTLCMLSTSIPELETHLSVLLNDCFLNAAYDEAIIVLLRCLTHLASRKVKTVECTEGFIRCITLLAVPLHEFRGNFILNYLKVIKPYNGDCYQSVWDVKVPQLIKYLEQNYDNFNQNEFQEMIFDFLHILLENVQDQDFNKKLIEIGRKQLEIYNNNRFMNIGTTSDIETKQNEKQFLLKCLAVILCHINDKEIVLQTIENILVKIKLTVIAELDACAQSIGICSQVHLDHVLEKLSVIRKQVLLKKISKFSFSFMKDQKHELEIERVRYVIISSYVEICNKALNEKLLRVAESEILEFVVDELKLAKDFQTRKICLKAIGAVADAMHSNRNVLHIRMLGRDLVLELVSSQIYLHNGSEYIELFPSIFPVITSLIKLPLALESEQRIKLLKQCFDNVYNASAIYCKINNISSESDNYYGDLKLVPFVTTSFTKLNLLVQEILVQNLSPATLDEIITLLEPWLGRKKPEQRLPAIETLRLVLQTYLAEMNFAHDGSNINFSQTGLLLAKVVPRATDPNKKIRKIAIESLYLILCIASRYEGCMRDHDKIISNSMQHIQRDIETDEPKLFFDLTSDLAHIICNNIPQFQLFHFVDGLIDALLDCEASSSHGSSIVLNLILKLKGTELQTHVTTIMEKLINQLDRISTIRTKSSALRSVLNFATHHSKAVCYILLDQQLPYTSIVCECWAILSTDLTLALSLLDQLNKLIKQTPLYEEQANGEIKLATLTTLQAVCALHELFKNTNLKEICQKHFSDIFSILLITLASYINVTAPAIRHTSDKKEKYFYLNREALKLKPGKIAVDTLKLFLLCCDYQQCATCISPLCISEANFETYLALVPKLVECIALENSAAIPLLVSTLATYIRAELEPQRILVTLFFSNLFKLQTNDDTILSENLLEMLLDVQLDSSCLVRKTALKGLGFATEYLNFNLVSRHSNPILSVLMNSLDYNSIGDESDVILEGLLTFSKLLLMLEGTKFSSCQVTAAVRIKPLMDHEDHHLREASLRLLGDLGGSLTLDGNVEAFREQIQGNFITLILHLSDPDPLVIKACKYTLRRVGLYLDSPKLYDMIQEHLIEEANLHYANFIRDLVKIMAKEMQELLGLFIMTCTSYLKSSWVEVKSSAALLIGCIYSHMEIENRQRLSIDLLCDKLTRLFSDNNELVRLRSIETVAILFID